MDGSVKDDGVIFEAVVFLSHFNDLSDARQPGKVVYPLDEVLLLALLRRFRPFRDGTPPHDRIGDIFATLDADHFQRCFVAWVASVTGLPATAQERRKWLRYSPGRLPDWLSFPDPPRRKISPA